MPTGVIKSYYPKKGYGFITPDPEEGIKYYKVFFLISSQIPKDLAVGQHVHFKITFSTLNGRKALKATKLVIICPNCNKTVKDLREHLVEEHDWKMCPDCKKIFEEDLDVHLTEEHNWEICPDCHKVVKDLDEHLAEEHAYKICNVCNRAVKNLKKHLLEEHGLRICLFCNMVYKDLEEHLIEEHGWKMCPDCDLVVKDLNEHLAEEHGYGSQHNQQDSVDVKNVPEPESEITEVNKMYDRFEEIPFQNRAKQRLRQIYAVLYYMKKGDKHTTAINKAYQDFKLKDNSTIVDKCTRQFAGKMKTFLEWYRSGIMLAKLVEKNELNKDDREIFAELLEDDGEKVIKEESLDNKFRDSDSDLSVIPDIPSIDEPSVDERWFSEDDDSSKQANLIGKMLEESAEKLSDEEKNVDSEHIREVTKSKETETQTVQDETESKDRPVKIESWDERQRKREVEIQEIFDSFVENVEKETKKEQFVKLDDKIFAVLKSVADRLREKDTRYKPSDPRILEVSQGPLYRWNKYKLDMPKFRSLHIDIANKQVPIPENANINIFGEELATEIHNYDKFILLYVPGIPISCKDAIIEQGFTPRVLSELVYITQIYPIEDFIKKPLNQITQTALDIIDLQDKLID